MFRCFILVLGLVLCSVSGCGGDGVDPDYVVPEEAIPTIPPGRTGDDAGPAGGEAGGGGRPSMPPG